VPLHLFGEVPTDGTSDEVIDLRLSGQVVERASHTPFDLPLEN
jgi:hypothetical protein